MRGREKEEIVEGLNAYSLVELPQFYLNANYSAEDERNARRNCTNSSRRLNIATQL